LSFAACLCLFAVAGAATAAASGGARTINPTLRVAVDNTDVDHSDPALAYSVLGWQMEYETCPTLVGYSDRSGTKVGSAITPTGAAGWPVISNHGKTYVFTLRNGMRFSNGDPVTAANYKYAFDRDALKNLNSPVTWFMEGVVGWMAENNNASVRSVSGVVASGMTLTIHLTKADGTMLPKLAMPFFCPLDKTAPFYVGNKWVDTEVNSPYPGAGPYYLATRTVGTDMVLQRNPYYSGARPHNASTIQIDMNLSTNAAFNGVTDGTYAADLNGNPSPANNQQLAQQFGINKSRFRVEPTFIISYLAMNEARPIFKSVGVRKGVNYAIDRPGLINNIGGYLSASPTTRILPPQLAGGVPNTTPYSTNSPGPKQFALAKTLSNNCGLGHTQPLYFWHGISAPSLAAAAVIKSDLQQMGCGNVIDAQWYCGRYVCPPKPPMDLATASWSDEYPDGYDYLGPLLDGRTLRNDPNDPYPVDLSRFNNAAYNKRLDQANALKGSARAKAFGELDQWVMTKYAPLAPISTTNFVDYLGPNAHGYVYNGPLGSVDLGDLYQS
jgi:peptide/nickel transport system substrate-binding protein